MPGSGPGKQTQEAPQTAESQQLHLFQVITFHFIVFIREILLSKLLVCREMNQGSGGGSEEEKENI